MSNTILEEIALLFIKLIPEDHVKMGETFKTILDPTRAYFKINDTDDNSEAPVNNIYI